MKKVNVAKEVLDMQIELKKLKKKHKETVTFLRTVGEQDPRSGGFIADRVLNYLHEPSNYLWNQTKEARQL